MGRMALGGPEVQLREMPCSSPQKQRPGLDLSPPVGETDRSALALPASTEPRVIPASHTGPGKPGELRVAECQ